MATRHLLVPTVMMLALAGACGGTGSGAAHPPGSRSASSSPAVAASPTASPDGLDSMVVLGHSGTTGYGSDPSSPTADVRENSWATGSNPVVDSVYRRLVASHPALKDHATSLGVDGSTVDDLDAQVTAMLKRTPVPGLVIIQTIDNDMRCDGTDEANQKPFGTTLDKVLTRIGKEDKGAQVYFVSQWGSVKTYTDAVKHRPAAVASTSGDGPCDTFTKDGQVRPAGIASEQKIVDGYWSQITRVCAAHPGCFTDGAHLQQMPLRESDLTGDSNHLGVAGLAVMAKYAWDALPDAIKNRP